MAEQSYLVAARKYRPLLFKDLVAQEHVTETLKNAIRLDRLAHAYMFTGPRGVGKTTAARVLAKAINCTTPFEEREEHAEPCRTCPSCVSFEEGRNLNIIEVDAASNNKVEHAHDLRETVRIPPQGGRKKVYIVDEVHMLSTAAFNALLKTLEEPPPYVLFIFATTEPHKVLPTIQSRCQRFDFRRIAVPEIVAHLETICKEEKIEADEASLMLIARKGDGALRDALSVFDQAVSLCGSTLQYEEIVRALGVVDADLYFEVTEAAAHSDPVAMIRIVERIVHAGYDLQEFLDGLAEHLRNLLVLKTVGDVTLIEATDEIRRRYSDEARRFSESVLLRFVHIIGETSDTIRTSRQPRLRLEIALLKMNSLPSALDLETALAKLDRLEEMVSSGATIQTDSNVSPSTPSRGQQSDSKSSAQKPASPPGKAATDVAPDTTRTDVAPDTTRTDVAPDATRTDAAPDATRTEDEAGPRPKRSRPEPEVAESEAETTLPDQKSEPELETAPVSDAPSRTRSPGDSASQSHPSHDADPAADDRTLSLPFDAPALKRRRPKTENRVESAVASDPTSVTDDVAVLAPDLPDADDLQVAWEAVVSHAMENRIRIGSLLRHTRIVGIQDEHMVVAVPDLFHERMLRNERQHLAQALLRHLETPFKDIHFKISEALAEELADPHDDTVDARADLKKKCEDNPAVQSLVERFGGEIVW